jgi:ketosteroid isomerase-like protein
MTSEGEEMKRTFVIALIAMSSLGGGSALAQSDAGAIKAANDNFYAAISERDAAAIDRGWEHEGMVFNIFAVNKAPMIGWSAVKTGYDDLFKRFAELSVTMAEPIIRQDGDRAVVVGVETQKAKLPSGDTVSGSLPATNVFIKRDGRWLMVHHHSSRPPQ